MKPKKILIKIAYTNITNILTRTNQSNEIWTYVLNNLPFKTMVLKTNFS